MKNQGTPLATLRMAQGRLLAFGLALCSIGAVLLATQPAPLRAQTAPQGGSSDFLFTQTGYTVPAVFMDYWRTHGGLAIFGYPISPVVTENGLEVQYFERNRFELHTELAGTPNEVELTLLGSLLTAGRTFPTVDPVPDTSDQHYFLETGHILAGVFYAYWQAHGGLAVFGYPISEEIQENGYTVQYFQRNRFEYHPELANTPYAVELGLLGRDYLALQGGAPPPASGPQPNPGVQAAATPGTTPPPGESVAGAGTQPPPDEQTSSATHPAPPITTGPTAVPVTGEFLQGPHVGYGMIVHMYYQDHQRILGAVKDIGFNWVKQQVQWSDTENPKGVYHWDELDKIVADCNAAGVNIMLSVVRTPDWATASGKGLPDNPQDLGNFMQVISARYAGRVQAYEIWNEENLGNETGVDHWHPARYAELLKAGFLGTRAGDPHAVVISGALTPTGVYNDDAVEDTWFLDQLYLWNNGELRNYYDALGIHPYGFWNPPDTMFPVKQPSDQTPASEYKNHGSFYFRRIEDQRAVMVKHGEAQKQIWVTEFGWCSDQRDGGYVECLNNSLQNQADYTVRAFQKAQQDYPFMGVMFLWNLNFSTFQEWYTGPAHFSILNPDWSPRPVYWALKNMPKP